MAMTSRVLQRKETKITSGYKRQYHFWPGGIYTSCSIAKYAMNPAMGKNEHKGHQLNRRRYSHFSLVWSLYFEYIHCRHERNGETGIQLENDVFYSCHRIYFKNVIIGVCIVEFCFVHRMSATRHWNFCRVRTLPHINHTLYMLSHADNERFFLGPH